MEGQDNADELYPIAVLIDELKVRQKKLLFEETHIDILKARRCSFATQRHS